MPSVIIIVFVYKMGNKEIFERIISVQIEVSGILLFTSMWARPVHIDGLAQDCGNSITKALQFPQTNV